MSEPTGNNAPEDGDLVAPPAKVAVPDDVAEAVRTIIRWAGDDPGARGPARHAGAGRPRVEGICQGYGEDPAVHLTPRVRGSRRL